MERQRGETKKPVAKSDSEVEDNPKKKSLVVGK
jgi:hypothetical protein